MHENLQKSITEMPEYAELLKRRNAITTPLAAIVLVAYYTFIIMVAYAPDLMGRPIVEDGLTSVGIIFGLGLILLTFAVTAFYVWYANTLIEPLLHTIYQKAKHDE
ncbi:DUF485 domain-containing protein [Micavibrio aeruginosavorus]|uniref:DUF485 domain-containing protein n=1 Tax=Micavibrio aeruginosavorus TaxID=349221 RepID=UPI003F4ADAC3